MRNEESWNNKIKRKFINQMFSPRIEKDLLKIHEPDDLPPLESYFIFGPVRTGKTIQAAFIFLQFAKEDYIAASYKKMIFVKTSEMFNKFKASFNDDTISEQEYLNQLSEADLLVLDDFGSERPTDWVLSMLYLLVDRRYENMKTTIYTSNLSLEEIADKFGDERIPSRIERSCKLIEKTKQQEVRK